MRRILTSVAAAAAVTAIAAAPASANGHKPAGTIVDVAVQASGGGTPDNNPYDYDLLVQAEPVALDQGDNLCWPTRPLASPSSRQTTGRSCGSSPTSAAPTRPARPKR